MHKATKKDSAPETGRKAVNLPPLLPADAYGWRKAAQRVLTVLLFMATGGGIGWWLTPAAQLQPLFIAGGVLAAGITGAALAYGLYTMRD